MPPRRRGRISLVLGGARSGKSAFAQRLAERSPEPVLFVATAEATDTEMAERIARHRAARPPHWRLLEVPFDVGRAVNTQGADARTVLLDCLSLLVSNVLLDAERAGPSALGALDARIDCEIKELVTIARQRHLALIIVSNEVGMSVVPPSPLGRRFRDALGHANQQVATAADAVYLLVAGIPVALKRGPKRVESEPMLP